MPKKKSEAPEVSFEEAVRQLETIVESMEEGGVGLDDLVTNYEKGSTLLRQCKDSLSNAELRIKRLRLDNDKPVEEALPLGDLE